MPSASTWTASAGALKAEGYDTIAAVDPAEWDQMVDEDDLLATHRFVRLCEESGVESAIYRHLVLRLGGRVVAVASLCFMHARLDLLAGPCARWTAKRVRSARPGFLRVPMVFCGLPVSFGTSCLRIGDPGLRPSVLALVTRAMDEFAKEHGAPVLALKEFGPQEAAILDAAGSLGYVRGASLPFYTLPITWPTPDDYLRSMRAGYRRQVLRSLDTATTKGLRVSRVTDFAPLCGRLFELYEAIMERAPFQLERLNRRFFELLNERMADRSEAMIIERDGTVLAAGVLLHSARSTTFLLAGIDYAEHRETAAYQRLLVEIVTVAVRRGSARLELGQTSAFLKSRLGAVPEPRALCVKHRRPWFNDILRRSSGILFPERPAPRRNVFRAHA